MELSLHEILVEDAKGFFSWKFVSQYHTLDANNNSKLGLAMWTFKWRLHEEAFCHAIAITWS